MVQLDVRPCDQLGEFPQSDDGPLQLGVEIHQLEEYDPLDHSPIRAEDNGHRTRSGCDAIPKVILSRPSFLMRSSSFLYFFLRSSWTCWASVW